LSWGFYGNDFGMTLGANNGLSVGYNGAVQAAPNNGLIIKGNVGIGTTNPSETLTLARSQSLSVISNEVYSSSNANTSRIYLRKSVSNTLGTRATTNNGAYLGLFNFQGVNTSNSFANGAYIMGIQDAAAGSYVPTRLDFVTYSATAPNSPSLSINSAGNVGIGTSNPGAKLDVNGDIRSNVTGASVSLTAYNPGNGYPRGQFLVGYGAPITNSGLIVAPADSASGVSYPVELAVNMNKNAADASNKMVSIYQASTYASIHSLGPSGNSAGTPLILSTQTYSGNNPAIYISNAASQNVGIGTTNPVAKLDLNGSLLTNSSVTLSMLAGGGTRLVTVDNSGVLAAITPPDILPAGQTGNTLYYDSKGWAAGSNIFNDGSNVSIALGAADACTAALGVNGEVHSSSLYLSQVASGSCYPGTRINASSLVLNSATTFTFQGATTYGFDNNITTSGRVVANSGFGVGINTGVSTTVIVKGSTGINCSLVFNGGILVAETCP